MKNIFLILLTCFLSTKTVVGQPKATDPIPENLKQMIIGYTCSAIDQFKAQLCPQFKDSIFIDKYGMPISGFSYLYPGLNSDFSYNFEIKRWPENSPYINFFLVIKKNNIMTRVRDSIDEKGKYVYDEIGNRILVTDTFAKDIPCYKYFPYDERYVVYYDTIKERLIYFSGNVYQTWLAYLFDAIYFRNMRAMAVTAVEFRLAQYSTPQTQLKFIRETEDFYEFSASETLLRDGEILVRIPKTDPFQFGSTWEMIYYSNTADVPGNTDRSFYEVKYTRSIRPKSYEELFPKYRKLTKEETREIYPKLRFYTDFAPLPEPEPEELPEEK
ncbi:MAG: hypothetical protein PWR03_961 [Tenuifilum sp.]|jgi:hypothetical protein|uniref:hypothetical protein n=1 Tax=Tenuifilum sp. TaxID=2760880 RepID=UPI0024AC6B1B|nr:hypothetical protein [Tenuifilum sp.]MDI3526778.1 hypothetical protein [Tenuifilum sp.]